jgi:hypothetical protein
MSLANFIPEIWSAKILSTFKAELVYGNLVNRDYEGDISQAGDSVRINSIGDPTVAPYVKGTTTITPEQLTSTAQNLLIDQSHYFAFEVDDIDKRQAVGNIMGEGMDRAAYKLAETVDAYIAGLYVGADVGNVTATTLVTLRTLLNKAGVPQQGRWVVIPSWYTGLLLENAKFVANPAMAQAGGNLLNGVVGRAAGFDVYESEAVPLITGDDYAVTAGYPGAVTLAEAINKVEAYRPEDSFADAVKGLLLFGAKLIRANGIAVLKASQT